jgi:chromosome segregation ATPase
VTDIDGHVSSRTAEALREAMKRLLAGQPRHTDGRRTKANLGREAGVSHATLHRAKALLREWDAAVAAQGEPAAVVQPGSTNETQELRSRLNDKTRECTELRRQLDAAATVIATLHHENGALRAQLNRDAIVISIDKPHHRADHRPVS